MTTMDELRAEIKQLKDANRGLTLGAKRTIESNCKLYKEKSELVAYANEQSALVAKLKVAADAETTTAMIDKLNEEYEVSQNLLKDANARVNILQKDYKNEYVWCRIVCQLGWDADKNGWITGEHNESDVYNTIYDKLGDGVGMWHDLPKAFEMADSPVEIWSREEVREELVEYGSVCANDFDEWWEQRDTISQKWVLDAGEYGINTGESHTFKFGYDDWSEIYDQFM